MVPEIWCATKRQTDRQAEKVTYKKNFMAPFYGWGSTTSRLEPLPGGSLIFTTKTWVPHLKSS